MNSTPLVTIAIPTYNRAKGFLRQALQSALDQTYRNLEILISDNCSADETSAVVASFEDPRIRYSRHANNIGANNNFNYCIQQARGKYLLLLPDDDQVDPDFVETCVNAAMGAGDIGLIRTGTRVINGEDKIIWEAPNRAVGLSLSDFFLTWFAGKTALYVCSTLFDTQKLQAIGGVNSKHNLFQDVMAEVKLAAAHGRVDVIDIKATFRLHDSEMSFAAGLGSWCEDSLLLLDLMCKLAPECEDPIRRKGMRFFARGNYHRAYAVKSRSKRLRAFLTVWRMFGYRQFPSYAMLRMLLGRTIANRALQSLKRLLRPALAGMVRYLRRSTTPVP